ncbi:hypothetical protein CEE45_14055 [Candidatus Heimdallarchaeota archaeon B3_Heim]|nr:MAG: hypothetical protein CEE45_14055 [Candidatus Heimdallarchaeota archaeon B3_Heim]
MSWLFEKISEFQVLIFEQSEAEEVHLSKHKFLILSLYLSAFVLTFLHFANIPADVALDVQIAAASNNPITIPSSPRLGLAILFYFYISIVAFITIFKGGSVPNFITRPRFPVMRRRYKVLSVIIGFIFINAILFVSYLIIISSSLIIIITGPVLYIIWTILEPFFLLSGILAIIRLIEADYPQSGFSSRGKRALILIFAIGYFTPVIFTLFLISFTSIGSEFSEISIFGQTFSFYIPAMDSFSRTFTSILSITLIFLLIWWIKDKYRGPSPIRERKKGMLPWFLGLTLILIILTVVPLIASTRGSLQEITSILDILGLFTAVIMGLWNALGVEQITEPLRGLKRLNPLEYIGRLHPYTKALFLLIISMFAFFSSMESNTIAAITGNPDTLKLQKLNLLAAFIGAAYFILLWRYKGQARSTMPGLLKTTQYQIEGGLAKIRSFISGERSVLDIPSYEEEE